MRSPWQVWLAFVVCLAMIVAAVGWLSFRALESDQAEATARRQAQAEENARLALWRIDTALAPLVMQENAQPYFSYSTLYPAERAPGKPRGKSTPDPVPSPLVTQPPPQVLLHFQIDGAGHFSSPRVPAEGIVDRVVPKFLSADQVAESKRLLDRVKSSIDRQALLATLPPPELPSAIPVQIAANYGFNGTGQLAFGANSAQPANTGNFANGAYVGAGGVQSVPQQPSVQQQPVNANGEVPQAAQGGTPQQEVQRQQRDNNEFQRRSQYIAQINAPPQNELMNASDPSADERTAMMTPLWLGDQLILARRVQTGGKELIQGCLLDWPAIQKQTLLAISDLLPDARLSAVTTPTDNDASSRSAVLPVRLELGALPEAFEATLTPVRMSLIVAWSSLLLGAAAVAMLLAGVMALSERRAAFVSAVTHELRTPLTTFRMYAEMLSEGMVPDEASRHRYLDTLRVEADRLTHLVENVLAYSRLERSKPSRRVGPLSVDELLHTAAGRLADRAAQAGFELAVVASDDVRQSVVLADPAAVEQILFNLVDNACKYAALATDRTLHIEADAHDGRFFLRVRDRGPGIEPARRRMLFHAFRKSAEDAAISAPGVGLGLALCRRLARDMGGDLRYEPQSSGGACFVLSLKAGRPE
jgi:signal transduction histidine kinase